MFMSTVDQFTPLVRRISAPNGSAMTGPGTNAYLIGKEEIAVLDPGPIYDSHIDAIWRQATTKFAGLSSLIPIRIIRPRQKFSPRKPVRS